MDYRPESAFPAQEFSDEPDFLDAWRRAKAKNKELAAETIRKNNAIVINPESMFDVQVKRIDEIKGSI